ncbi:MAG: molybdopterin-synthase adenylyltransferase MoeB, partial [Planctomycetes bacterium]|nr:molybdopterin-synthase adenylyltransferase MoeB [Planctomycetota bacterium]
REEAPTSADVGVLGPVVGVMGTSQALEAVRVLTGVGETFAHRLGAYDGRTGVWRMLRRRRDPACPLCGSAG